MSPSPDRMTRATREAANIAAAAVVVYAVLWLLSTQVSPIRAVSPFQVDPWDAFATYAAIFLPFVAGPTWVRSLRHRETVLPATIAARIRWGSGLASALVLVAAGTAAEAVATIGFDRGTGTPAALLTALVCASIGLSITAIVLTIRAASVAGRGSTEPDASEPDIVDDVLAL